MWGVVADANRYFAGEEPWAKRKTDFKRMETILYVTAEVVRQVAILAQPVMPAAAGKLLDGLGQGPEARSFKALGEAGRLKPGTAIPPPAGVFPRYVEPATEDRRTEAEERSRRRSVRSGEWSRRLRTIGNDGRGRPSVMLVDHHCHLDFPDFAAELDGVRGPRAARPASA